MSSNLYIGTARDRHIRIYLANTKQICEDARQTHTLYPTSLAALGRVLSVTAVMGSMLKGEDESVTTTINGNGPIGTVMAVANSKGEVKGFCGDPTIYLKYTSNNKLAVGLAVGKEGYLKVLKDLKLKNNYVSQVKLQTGEIGDDFAYFFNVSEQTPSIVSVGVLVDTDYACKAAGCLLIQLMPNHVEEDIQYLENILKTLEPISTVLDKGIDPKEYLKSLFPDIEILEEKELVYKCDCSRERFLRNLLTLPKKDLEELAQDEKIEVKCEFCNKTYTFTKEELLKVLGYAS